MPRSQAQKEADKRYAQKVYEPKYIRFKKTDYINIKEYINKLGMSENSYIIACCKYCMNNNIDVSKIQSD